MFHQALSPKKAVHLEGEVATASLYYEIGVQYVVYL